MNIDELREQIPDETNCRKFFENLIWAEGRLCPHCHCSRSYPLNGISSRPGFMSVPNVNGSLRLPLELQCTARNYRFGNGFWLSIT